MTSFLAGEDWTASDANSLALQADLASRPKGYIGRVTATSNGPQNITTTETLDNGTDLTFTFDTTRIYRVRWQGEMNGSVGGDYIEMRFRIANGTSVTNTDTTVNVWLDGIYRSGDRQLVSVDAVFDGNIGISDGTSTIGIFVVRQAGSGNIDFRGDTNSWRQLSVEDIGEL